MAENRLERTIDIKENNRKLILSVFLRTIFAAVLNAIIYISFVMIISGFFKKPLYYQVFYRDPVTSETSLMYTIPTATKSSNQATQSTDSKQSSYSSNANETATSTTADPNIMPPVPVLPDSKTPDIVGDIIAQVFMLTLFLSFPYSILWEQGDKDANYVKFGHIEEDKLRGLKIGAIAALPSLIPFVFLVLSKLAVIPQKYFLLYRVLNLTFWPLINLMVGGAANALVPSNYSWPVIIALLLVQGLLPLIAHVAYLLGYNHISLSEKLIYKSISKKKKRR